MDTLSSLKNLEALHPSRTERSLSAKVEDLKQIHGLSLRLAEAGTLADVLMDVLRTAARLVDARLGSVQLLNDGKLEMIGQVGFGDTVLNQFAVVTLEDCSTCAVALKRRARVTIPDLRKDRDFTEIATALRSYGAVGAVSTSVLDKAGNVLAMFSVYWLEQHKPDERELQALDLCAELAGRHVERSISTRELKDHDQRQVLLMRELAHRGKNLLAIVRAIAGHSLRGERTLDDAREAFIGRLEALSNTYNTLTEQSPESVQLHDVIVAGMSSYSERAKVHGPAVLIRAKKAQTLALVIHELATNAVKYGALSNSGHVEVTWEISDQRLSLRWMELGGPPITTPVKLGFGSVIITSVVREDLNCEPTLEYRNDGFRYRLDCSLNDLTDRGA